MENRDLRMREEKKLKGFLCSATENQIKKVVYISLL
jgi:hypothetical protein